MNFAWETFFVGQTVARSTSLATRLPALWLHFPFIALFLGAQANRSPYKLCIVLP
jgi:hypothetical protein